MEPKLTIKRPDGTHALTNEGLRYLLRLYEIAYGINLKKEYSKRSVRRMKPLMLDSKSKCMLCSEAESLDEAHVIPAAITRNMEIEEMPAYLTTAISLCPTHHRKYDKYQLNESDKETMRDFIRQKRYTENFKDLVSRVEVIKPDKNIDHMLQIAWRWWREYCYGNS